MLRDTLETEEQGVRVNVGDVKLAEVAEKQQSPDPLRAQTPDSHAVPEKQRHSSVVMAEENHQTIE